MRETAHLEDRGEAPESTDVVHSLQRAFEAFNTSAQKLTQAYAELEKKFQNVNRELEEANRQLRRNLEEKQRLHHYLESILNSMSTGVVVFNREGQITLFNRAAERICGRQAREVIGQSCESVFQGIGYHIPEPRDEHDVQPPWLPPDRRVPLDVHTDLVRDGAGNVLGVVLLLEDISEHKKLEEQIQRTNRLAALGKMAAEVAHEIRNPLAAMQIYARILQQELDGDLRHLADELMTGIQSLEVISGNMLSLARPLTPRLERIDLAKVLEDALEFSIYALEENDIQLIRRYPPEGLYCEADFLQLKQVALNLILNAIQAMPEGGQLEIAISQADDQTNLVWRTRDTGCGIPEEDLDRIFTPFFSSKPSGTGLGLHTVERILQAHQATIDVVSEVGKGTEFIIRLPMHQRADNHEHTEGRGAHSSPS